MDRRALAAVGILLALLGAHAALVLTAAPMEPLRAEALAPDAASAPVDERHALARLHAPWILHETSARLGRQDIPSAMDFDGDRDATNNWENLPRYELVPTIYYTVVETETHWFLTYHLYYPRDWTRVPLGLQDSHEGDGGNVQVVVEKGNGTIVLLVTQAERAASGYAGPLSPVQTGDEALRGSFEIVTGHPVVYVRSGGHGLYGSHDPRAANRLARMGEPVVTYRPAEEGETPSEPQPPWEEMASYRLVSLVAFLDGSTDHPTLFAGYEDGTPRHHRGDRYSGPLGASRGVSPFALGFGWSDREFDGLFWEPAARYQDAFAIRGAWSTQLAAHPFRT